MSVFKLLIRFQIRFHNYNNFAPCCLIHLIIFSPYVACSLFHHMRQTPYQLFFMIFNNRHFSHIWPHTVSYILILCFENTSCPNQKVIATIQTQCLQKLFLLDYKYSLVFRSNNRKDKIKCNGLAYYEFINTHQVYDIKNSSLLFRYQLGGT